MSDQISNNQISPEQVLRKHFLSWQCRIRQHAVRIQDGRPTQGMQATVLVETQELCKLIVLINKKELSDLVTEFQFMYKKTNDPAIRRSNILKVLVAGYFQHGEEFSDQLTATINEESEIAQKLLASNEVKLHFYQQQQEYEIPCSVIKLSAGELQYQATYWHNAIFNPYLPQSVQIIAFNPIWNRAKADPLPNELKQLNSINE